MKEYIEVEVPVNCKKCSQRKVNYNGSNRCIAANKRLKFQFVEQNRPLWCPIKTRE